MAKNRNPAASWSRLDSTQGLGTTLGLPSMTSPKRSLDVIAVNAPCEEPWDEMTPRGEGRRHCDMCMQDVYDLSALTTAEGESLVFGEGRVCVRFYRRLDGTVVTSDCTPVRQRALGRMAGGALRLGAKVAGGLLAGLALLGVGQAVGIDVLGSVAKTPIGRTLLPGLLEPPLAGEPMMHDDVEPVETSEPSRPSRP